MLHFERWKIAVIGVICLLGVAYASPNVLPRDALSGLPRWLPSQTVNLGLDLQGGSHLLLEVDLATVTRERLESVVDAARTALRQERIGYTGLGIAGEAVTVKIREAKDIERARTLLRQADSELQVTIAADGTATLALSEEAIRERRRTAVEQSIEIVRRRVDETGTREPTIVRQGDDRILVQLPGLDDPERVKALLGKTAKMTFRLVDVNASVQEALGGRVPAGSELLAADNPREGQTHYVVRRRVMVSGDTLVDAQPTFQNGEAVVSFRFDSVGAKRFADVTRDNVGRPFAIVLDDKVISAPVIREPILGGSGIISGSFTVQSAQDLALLLRAGALPAPLNVLEERTVGPGLGADSIEAGKVAAVIGCLLVVAFMVVAYGLFGLFANLALVFNLVFMFALLSALQATLTLPGIAGIALTLGMAVDSNVLIFERIREEAALGRTPISAIDAGFQRALTTIIDSQLTTVFAAAFLYAFGSGPVRGFAVTLTIGIVTSMFCALVLTRLMIVIWLRSTRPQAVPI